MLTRSPNKGFRQIGVGTFVRGGCKPSVVPVISTLNLRPRPLDGSILSYNPVDS